MLLWVGQSCMNEVVGKYDTTVHPEVGPVYSYSPVYGIPKPLSTRTGPFYDLNYHCFSHIFIVTPNS